jgi:hypothetical protein
LVNDVPLVLPRTVRVWVRDSQFAGSFNTSRDRAFVDPRSAWSHWGKALLLLSQ